jgi:hypothetical protein
MLALYAEARRRKSLQSRIKAENFLVFRFSLEVEKRNAAIETRAEDKFIIICHSALAECACHFVPFRAQARMPLNVTK